MEIVSPAAQPRSATAELRAMRVTMEPPIEAPSRKTRFGAPYVSAMCRRRSSMSSMASLMTYPFRR